MTIQNIIDDIKTRLPSGFSDSQILTWVNNIIEEVWQDVAFNEVSALNWAAGARESTLPSNCDFSAINAVTVDNAVYSAKHAPDFTTQNIYFKTSEGKIAINPVPSQNAVVKIYYLKKPATVSLTDNVPIRSEFIELIKNGVFIIIAKSMRDVALANNYVEDYNISLSNARQRRLLYSAAYPQVRSYQ